MTNINNREAFLTEVVSTLLMFCSPDLIDRCEIHYMCTIMRVITRTWILNKLTRAQCDD